MSGISRRAALRGIGHSAALGTLAVVLPHHLRAAEVGADGRVGVEGRVGADGRVGAAAAPPAPALPPATDCLVMVYTSGEGRQFDADAFRDRHLPLLRQVYGDTVERVELRVAPAPVEGVAAPPVKAAVNIWIRDTTKFLERVSQRGAEVAADISTITNIGPIVQFDKVIYSGGEARTAVPLDSSCVSVFFLPKEGGSWDSKYYTDTYLPRLLEIAGNGGLLRLEASENNPQQPGQKLPLHSSIHMYIGDEAAYEAAAGSEAMAALDAEAQKKSTLSSIGVLMRVHGAV